MIFEPQTSRKNYNFLLSIFCFVFLFISFFFVQAAELNPGDLIQASQPAVYYYSGNGKRYVFPNERVYFSWFINFNKVKKITDAELAAIPIGGVVTYKPGTRMIKVQSDPRVYAVSRGGLLRWITNEQVARDLYGANWKTIVHDFSDAYFIQYRVGLPINTVNDFSAYNEFSSSISIDADLEYRGRTLLSEIGTPVAPISTPPSPPITTLPTPSSSQGNCKSDTTVCDAQHYCQNNQCILKAGCAYNNPSCGVGFTCVKNSCEPVVVDPCAQYTMSPVVTSTLQYVILTRPLFTTALQPFIQSKSNVGTYLIDQIACTVQGVDIQEKMRNFLRSVRTTASGAKYVLLVGAPASPNKDKRVTTFSEPWEVPIRYIKTIGTYSDLQEQIPTDQYFATVDTHWPLDDPQWAAEFDFHPNFFVGRVPLKTTEEVSRWVTKTLQWRPRNTVRHSIFRSVACQTRTNLPPSLDILAKLTTHRIFNHNCSSDAGGDVADLSVADQADFITSMSHGSYLGITKWPWSLGYDLTVGGHGFPQKNPVMYVHGCEVAGMDYPSASMGQDLIGRADGVTAFIGASRSHWDIDFPFWQSVFLDGNLTAGEALYNLKFAKAKRTFLPLREVDNFFMFHLFGDPSLTLIQPSIVVSRENVDVPFSSLQDGTVQLTARVSSSLSESVFGVLRYSYVSGFFPESPTSTSVPPYTGKIIEGGPWHYAGSQDLDNASEAYVFPTAVGFTGCDFERMSCLASRVVIRAKLPIQCGRPSISEGIKSLEVRFRGSAALVKLRLEETPGYYCASGICPPPTATILAEQTVAASNGATTNITWTRSAISEPLPTKFTVPYYFPLFRVKALDALGVVIGSCTLNPIIEPVDSIL